jgi:glycosyltransferase involved in cell wall biosynthesis
MRIAFYAPLKSPNHPVPSGDRQMARLLIAALEHAGHDVEIASELRSFTTAPNITGNDEEIASQAQQETDRLRRKWQSGHRPDLWFCYHPYYKAPDLIGPQIAAALDIPYVTAEASYSKRRNGEGWSESQSLVAAAIRMAAVNICFTKRDEAGLSANISDAKLASLKPFIDVSPFQAEPAIDNPHQLVTVAMMRPGDKLESYRMLAQALALIEETPWRLSVIGDGPLVGEVRGFFARFHPDRIEWFGEKRAHEVIDILYKGGTYVWPGTGEAYGIAYLEAQAAGLPVVAQATAGVPEVVQGGVTGILTTPGDTRAFADAIAGLLADSDRHAGMGRAARSFVRGERSLDVASVRLDHILRDYTGWIE